MTSLQEKHLCGRESQAKPEERIQSGLNIVAVGGEGSQRLNAWK